MYGYIPNFKDTVETNPEILKQLASLKRDLITYSIIQNHGHPTDGLTPTAKTFGTHTPVDSVFPLPRIGNNTDNRGFSIPLTSALQIAEHGIMCGMLAEFEEYRRKHPTGASCIEEIRSSMITDNLVATENGCFLQGALKWLFKGQILPNQIYGRPYLPLWTAVLPALGNFTVSFPTEETMRHFVNHYITDKCFSDAKIGITMPDRRYLPLSLASVKIS